jgi:S1-C subfamily serine protease
MGRGTAIRLMRRACLSVLIGFWIVGFVLGSASFAALAQDDANRAYLIVKSEDENGKSHFAFMGIYMDDLTHRVKSKLKYPHETGVLITKVEEASPADDAGLAENDIVYLFDGDKVENSAQLASLVRAQKPGAKAVLVVYRSGAEKKVTVTLGARKSPIIITDDFGKYSEELSKAMSDANRSAIRIYRESLMMKGRLGMVLHNLDEELAGYFGVKKDEGVLVLDVEDDSPAAKAGIKSGDVVVGMNGDAVSGAEDFMDALSKAAGGDTVSLDVVRKGSKKTVELEIEEGLKSYQLHIAPFERSETGKEPLKGYLMKKNSEEAAKLKEEMNALKERLQELEDRLNKAEKKEQ